MCFTKINYNLLAENKINSIFFLPLCYYFIKKSAKAKNLYIMGRMGPTEWIVILIVVLLLFGGKKIPELMKGLGSGVKEFKDASKGDQPADSKKEETKE